MEYNAIKDFNLYRLLDNCAVKIPDDVFDALMDYLMGIDVDLNTFNVDDFYMNALFEINLNDFNKLNETEKKEIIDSKLFEIDGVIYYLGLRF